MIPEANRDIRGGITRIRSVYASLAPAERKVADFIVANSEQVIYYSVTQLAEASGVGESTVIRFCQNSGFRGYQELKMVLARELVEPAADLSSDITANDSLEDIVKKVGYSNARAVENTLDILDLSELKQAINSFVSARKIEFYGVGQSAVTALDAKYRFMRLGIICDALTDSHVQMMSAATLGPNDVALGISFSGSTKDIVEAISKAKEMGATTICVTAYARAPLARIADITLLTASLETPGSGSLRSKIAQLLVLDVLYTAVAIRMGAQGRRYTELTAEAVLDKLY